MRIRPACSKADDVVGKQPDRSQCPTRCILTEKRSAAAIALAFFFGWLAVLYAGADHPPPPGFLALVLLDLAAAFVVYLRVPVYARWSRARRPKRWLRALFEGVVAGLLVAGLALVLPFGGEPSLQPAAPATLIWFVVVAAVGGGNAALIFALSAATAQRL
jgi:hypothetical protein